MKERILVLLRGGSRMKRSRVLIGERVKVESLVQPKVVRKRKTWLKSVHIYV